MNIAYPASVLNDRKIDEMFQEEATILRENGHTCFNYFNHHEGHGEALLYRGWMLSYSQYVALTLFAERNNFRLITSIHEYYLAHHITSWYKLVEKYTPKTFIFHNMEDLKRNIHKTGLHQFFVKDSVKSLTTGRGSIAKNEKEVFQIVEEIDKFKEIEGKIIVREVHNFIESSEVRYFSIKGKAYSPNGSVSKLAKKIGKIFKHLPFISIDIIKDEQDKEWLVEIGDGQVSDLKMWDGKDFAKMLHNIK